MPLIDGQQQDLAAFKGKVILIVNTASRCGLTGQYAGLQELYENKEAEGFVILGFPANNFQGQEPGSDEQIAEFCKTNFGVSFPMFSKISVKGDDATPLYRQLTSQPAPIGGDIRWNFDKFLVDREGNVVARFDPRTKPDDKNLLSTIDELLRRGG
ncbi:MAG: glutathione peroxidase [Phycisphaeraceae bacterium]|nr:glutathione peroxidase [Phycisphaeraceae bacterium]